VKPLLKLFFDICRLRARPQDVPASGPLMLLAIIAVVISGIPAIVDAVGGPIPAISISLLDVVLTLVLLKTFLGIMDLSPRLLQSATAIFGSGLIVNLFSLPVIWLLHSSTDNSGYRLLGGLLYYALLIWGLVIMGHILRHSFNLRLSSGILIAMAYFMLINTLVQRFLSMG
jgi:hypothetical protein